MPEGCVPKGDVLAVARVAAIQAAKRTWELIPLCHLIALSGMDVAIEPAHDGSGLRFEVAPRTIGSTGVEMEALRTALQELAAGCDVVVSTGGDVTPFAGPVLLRAGG